MEDVEYALGPAFQKHLEAESLSGTRSSRSIVSLTEPKSTYTQSVYQMHPTCVDGILQACAPALWNGNRTNINAVLIPAIIDDVLICSQPKSTTTGIAVVSSSYTGLGDMRDTNSKLSRSFKRRISSGWRPLSLCHLVLLAVCLQEAQRSLSFRRLCPPGCRFLSHSCYP